MDEIPDTRPSLLLRIHDPQDERAWREFLDIYEPLVYRLARRKGFQDADARELTQEVFLAVASAIDRWDPDPSRGSFRAWLFKIARNLMINLLARQRRHPQGTGSTDVKHLLEEQAAPAGEDSALFDRQFKREAFRWAAEQIRGQFRETTWKAFWLTSVENREIREVAEELGITAGAVYIARSRVMARLRQTVEGLEGT
ncbi:MAG: RNA polymerase sigma factor [Planctomycetota bacterium]|jgi:RNA polymerase sigma-70 factor (ECF subfamily)